MQSIAAMGSGDGVKVHVEPIIFEALQDQLKQVINYDVLVVAGGDGTFSTVLSNLGKIEVPVGIIPLGTGNDLARTLGVMKRYSARNPLKLLQHYQAASSQKFQLWCLSYGENFESKHYFVNYLSFGFDAKVISKFATMRKQPWYGLHHFGKWGNRLGYLSCGLAELFVRTPLRISSVNAESFVSDDSSWSLFFANIREVMGLGTSNNLSDPSDDKLEGLLVRKFLDYLPFSAIPSSKLCPKMLGSHSSWEIEFKEAPWMQLDGEGHGKVDALRYKVSLGPVVKLLRG